MAGDSFPTLWPAIFRALKNQLPLVKSNDSLTSVYLKYSAWHGMAWQSPSYATLLILASECCSRGLNLCCCSLEEIRKRFKSVCLQTFSRSMIGRGVHVTMAEDILYLLFTFCGRTFGYDIFIFHHIWLSAFLMYNPACFLLLCSIFSGTNWQSYSQSFLRNKHLIALAALIFTNYSVEL